MPRFRMFIDDTGNVHSRTSNHPQNRYAGIVGVIFDVDYLKDRFDSSFKKLKSHHFGVDNNGNAPILHLRRMKKAEKPFSHLANECCRRAWEDACFRMYDIAAYTVISVCVDKVAFYATHPNWQGSVYQLLVGNAIERYFYFLRSRRGDGDVLAEATNSTLDLDLKTLYQRFYEVGTDHIAGATLRTRLSSKEIKIKPKTADIAGLQMADLLASTCFAHSKKIYAEGPDFDAFAMRVADLLEREKFYRDWQGNPHGYGRVWRP